MAATPTIFAVLAITLSTVSAQFPAPGFFNVPATAFGRGGRINFSGSTLGQVCKSIMLMGGKEALSDGMGAAAKWFSQQKITSQAAGGADPQMRCLYAQATGSHMPGMMGQKDPGNMFGDYYDTVIEYPMILDPCSNPQCNGKVNPTVLLMQTFAPMMRGMGGAGMGLGNPMAGMGNPMAGMANPMAGMGNPMAGMGNPMAGMANPMAGMNNVMGMMNNPLASAIMNPMSPFSTGAKPTNNPVIPNQGGTPSAAPTPNTTNQKAPKPPAPTPPQMPGMPNMNQFASLFQNPQFMQMFQQFFMQQFMKNMQGQAQQSSMPSSLGSMPNLLSAFQG